jgi:signal peptidase I
MSPGLKLDLADGQRWVIRPVDEPAAEAVAELGKVMRLGPACGSDRPDDGGRELRVAVWNECDRLDAEFGGSAVCHLVDPKQAPFSSLPDRDMQVIQMQRIASRIARETLTRGGLLLHGALAENQQSGFIMAGTSGMGKSTASRRLPAPWRSLCDDRTLVMRDGNGRFWAHPWPTWSLFKLGGPGGSWAVEDAKSLRAIFFLDRSPSDQLEPVNATQATALILESALDLAGAAPLTNGDAAWTLCSERVGAARALAAAVPAFSLKLSLDGQFWQGIERVLPVGTLPESGEDSRNRDSVSVESLMPRDSLRVVCTGTSMSPTLRESDLLEVEPYGTGRVHSGDVVCFKSSETGKLVVHRVVSVQGRETRDGRLKEGIRTRGDNNPTDDTGILQAGDIIGRVKTAQRGGERLVVHGGWRGPVGLRCARLGRVIRRCAGPLPRILYVFFAGLGPLERLLPAHLRPRLVRFDARSRVFLRLLIGRRVVGQYDDRYREWQIRRPFRLFVDVQTLPVPQPENPSSKP